MGNPSTTAKNNPSNALGKPDYPEQKTGAFSFSSGEPNTKPPSKLLANAIDRQSQSVPVIEPAPRVTERVNETAWQSQNAAQLWSQWKTLLEHAELQQIPIINALLVERFRSGENAEIYHEIRKLLSSSDFSVQQKALLLDLLTETATPDALLELLKLSELGAQSPLYAFVLQSISRIGDVRWEGQFHEELSPLLESAWDNPAITDEQLLTAIATAIAKIGSPEGIAHLLETISNRDNAVTVNTDIDRMKQSIAFSSAGNVRNPNATNVLAGCLNQTRAVTSLSEICMEGLARIGTPKATGAILDHAQQAGSSAARPISHALNLIQNSHSLELVSQAPRNRIFRAPEVATAVNSAAASLTESSTLPDHKHR